MSPEPTWLAVPVLVWLAAVAWALNVALVTPPGLVTALSAALSLTKALAQVLANTRLACWRELVKVQVYWAPAAANGRVRLAPWATVVVGLTPSPHTQEALA